MKGMLGAAWAALRTWEMLEPPDLHPPAPLKILQAMVVCACCWRWWDMAATLCVGFWRLLRPSEYLSLSSGDFSWPWDHNSGEHVFVSVWHHKMTRSGPRHAHVRLDQPVVVSFLCLNLGSAGNFGRIFDGSSSTFRRRFDLLQQAVCSSRCLIPSSLRPGGATHLFQSTNERLPSGEDKWASQNVLRHYIQELGAVNVFAKLPAASKAKVNELSALFDQIMMHVPMDRCCRWLQSRVVANKFDA